MFTKLISKKKSSSNYEILWKNMVEPDRPQMTIKYDAWALHAGYLDTHSEYVILLFHGKNGYPNTPQCYVYTYIVCFFF